MRSSKYGVNFSFLSDQVWNWMVPLSSPEVSMGPAPPAVPPPPVQLVSARTPMLNPARAAMRVRIFIVLLPRGGRFCLPSIKMALERFSR
jgi:hypothetical protein